MAAATERDHAGLEQMLSKTPETETIVTVLQFICSFAKASKIYSLRF